ncbi:hypothetical protein PilKf_00575 [Pillotina sp. SPG140]|jgi:hypothetical protein
MPRSHRRATHLHQEPLLLTPLYAARLRYGYAVIMKGGKPRKQPERYVQFELKFFEIL